MAAKPTKKVSFRVLRGIRINGQNIFPPKDKKKKTIISIRESLAKELVNASKGEIVDAKANVDVSDKTAEELELDAAFGDETNEGEE